MRYFSTFFELLYIFCNFFSVNSQKKIKKIHPDGLFLLILSIIITILSVVKEYITKIVIFMEGNNYE